MGRFALAAVPLVLIPALGAVQGGFLPDAWVWSGALGAWAAAVGLILDPRAGRLARDFRWALAAAALLLWTFASALWSVVPAQSVLEARRTLVYGAVVLALIVLARRASSSQILLRATHVAIAALVGYALVRYLLGARVSLEFEGHLLTEPLGYANGVGILAAMSLVLSAGTATSTRPWLRAASAASVPLLALSLDLTGSDASWLALAVGCVLMLALDPDRGSLVRTLVALAPATAVAVWIGHHSELTAPGAARWSGPAVALLGAGCAGAAAATMAALPPSPRGPRPRRRFALPALLAVVALGAAAVALGGATEPRRSYYHVAWHEYLAHPLLGSGAGTFGHYWAESGRIGEWGGALDAHSLYLETLAELGPFGLCLLLAFLLYPLRRAAATRASPGVPAAAGAAAAFLVHAGLDWDWELPAVVIAGLACSAVVAFAEAQRGEATSVARTARVVALAAAFVAGAAAIAGTQSNAEPGSAPQMLEAPQSEASSEPS